MLQSHEYTDGDDVMRVNSSRRICQVKCSKNDRQEYWQNVYNILWQKGQDLQNTDQITEYYMNDLYTSENNERTITQFYCLYDMGD